MKKENFSLFGYFKCFNEKKYLINEKVCNGIVDCLYGSDEMFCEISKLAIKNCQQFNYLMMICDENFQINLKKKKMKALRNLL